MTCRPLPLPSEAPSMIPGRSSICISAPPYSRTPGIAVRVVNEYAATSDFVLVIFERKVLLSGQLMATKHLTNGNALFRHWESRPKQCEHRLTWRHQIQHHLHFPLQQSVPIVGRGASQVFCGKPHISIMIFMRKIRRNIYARHLIAKLPHTS